MSNFMSLADEAEIGATFINGQESAPIQTTLAELVQPQPLNPIGVDNSTAEGFVNDTIKQKRSKSINMCFYWVQVCTLQKQFPIYCKTVITNLGDYDTNHHPASHHCLLCFTYFHPTNNLFNTVISHILQGCVNPAHIGHQYTRDLSPIIRLQSPPYQQTMPMNANEWESDSFTIE